MCVCVRERERERERQRQRQRQRQTETDRQTDRQIKTENEFMCLQLLLANITINFSDIVIVNF